MEIVITWEEEYLLKISGQSDLDSRACRLHKVISKLRIILKHCWECREKRSAGELLIYIDRNTSILQDLNVFQRKTPVNAINCNTFGGIWNPGKAPLVFCGYYAYPPPRLIITNSPHQTKQDFDFNISFSLAPD